jgi:hypothetical protein
MSWLIPLLSLLLLLGESLAKDPLLEYASHKGFQGAKKGYPIDEKNVILYTVHPKHYYVLPDSLKLIMKNYNCDYHVPIIIFYDHMQPHEYFQLKEYADTLSTCAPIYLVSSSSVFLSLSSFSSS